jgi:hypothetical protein
VLINDPIEHAARKREEIVRLIGGTSVPGGFDDFAYIGWGDVGDELCSQAGINSRRMSSSASWPLRSAGNFSLMKSSAINGRQKKLSFGIYGSDDEGRVSLATARKKRDEAKALIAKGIDPGIARKEERLEKATARPFASWADEWLAKQEAECGERSMNGKRRFVGYLKDQFGSSMIGDIALESVVAYLKTLQNEGKLETRDRVRAAGEDICKFADLKRTRHNPFRDLGDFLIQNVCERRPAITEPINAVAQLFQDIAAPLDDSRFGDLVGHALRFLSPTAVRPGEVNNSEWDEID